MVNTGNMPGILHDDSTFVNVTNPSFGQTHSELPQLLLTEMTERQQKLLSY